VAPQVVALDRKPATVDGLWAPSGNLTSRAIIKPASCFESRLEIGVAGKDDPNVEALAHTHHREVDGESNIDAFFFWLFHEYVPGHFSG
jgi:hypothetical protein